MAHRYCPVANMKRIRAMSAVFGIALTDMLSSSCIPRGISDTSKPSLIGGDVAESGRFPGVVVLNDGCTAAKVGPRAFLTAAHCVTDTFSPSLRPEYWPGPMGRSLAVTTPGTSANAERVDLELESVYVPRQWMSFIERKPGFSSESMLELPEMATDIAVLRVKTDSPQIPTLDLGKRQPNPGDEVFVLGFGCETTVDDRQPSEVRRLKFARVPVAPFEALYHAGSPVNDIVGLSRTSFVTRGPTSDPASPGLCPGDSGGPVLDANTGQVVGVNSTYTFLPGVRVPATNVHALVMSPSSVIEDGWLASALTGKATMIGIPSAESRYLEARFLAPNGPALEVQANGAASDHVFAFRHLNGASHDISWRVEAPPGSRVSTMFRSTRELTSGVLRPPSTTPMTVGATGKEVFRAPIDAVHGVVFLVVVAPADHPGGRIVVSATTNSDPTFTQHCLTIHEGAPLCIDSVATDSFLEESCKQRGWPHVSGQACPLKSFDIGCADSEENAFWVTWYADLPVATIEARCRSRGRVLTYRRRGADSR